MADSETGGRRLQVANARPEDSGRGIAHLPRSVMALLGVNEGDVVPITLAIDGSEPLYTPTAPAGPQAATEPSSSPWPIVRSEWRRSGASSGWMPFSMRSILPWPAYWRTAWVPSGGATRL